MKSDEWFKNAERYVRSYAKGMDGGGFRRLFDRDAARAYGVITREHEGEREPENTFWRFLYRTRIFLLGLSFKLSPPRRLLFALCMVLALYGVVGIDIDNTPTLKISLLHLLSIAGLVLLLMLELADRIVVRDELEIARDLQRELLPQRDPQIPGYAFAFSYRTANTIGGDYYDFVPLAGGRHALVVGDASGHGIAAGILMAIANSALKIGLDLGHDPVAVTRMTNQALCRVGDRRAFMTLFCAILEPASGRLNYVCAGHAYPFLRDASGAVRELGSGCLPLGMRPDLELEADQAEIEAGDTLLLYTDGVVETLNADGESFGFDRLRRALAGGGSVRSIHDRVIAELDAFRGDEPVFDDCSLVVISRDLPVESMANH